MPRHGRGHRFKSCRTHHFFSIAFSCVTIVSQQRKERRGFDQETQQQMAGAGSPSWSQPDLENISVQAGEMLGMNYYIIIKKHLLIKRIRQEFPLV